jgi:hypothetical protein
MEEKEETEIYEGVIIKDSLEDPSVLDDMEVISHEIEPLTNWDIYKVRATPDDFESLSKIVKPLRYYIHFWKGFDVVVIFRNKIFKYRLGDEASWKRVIEYGLSMGIPIDQLDFPTQ